MRKRIVTVFILCIAWNAQAQLVVSISDAQSQAEQMRINKERAVLETQYAAQETECYKRFAVNSCLGELRARKRLSMDALRRQEIVLNDVQRKTRALELGKQNQEKTSPAALKEEADSREAAQIQHKERLDREQKKKTDAAEKEMQTGTGTIQPPGLERSSAKGASAQAQQAFEEKQRSAQERKMQRDKSLAEKSSKPASPLPSNP